MVANEVRIWAKLEHPSVLRLLGYTLEGSVPSLISEWMENGSLRQYMATVELSAPQCLSMVKSIFFSRRLYI